MDEPAIQKTFDLAMEHHQAGRLQDAKQLYRQVLAQQPDHIDALHFLGVVAHQLGRNDMAIELISRAITLRPDHAPAHYNLALALKDEKRVDEAIAAYRRAIALKPNYAEAHNNVGVALAEKGRVDEAITDFRLAIALRPNYPDAHNNLGNALKSIGQIDEALAEFRLAIDLNPNFIAGYNSLGDALKDKGQLDEAVVAFERAIAIKPDYAEARSNLALILLLRGDFARGWVEYEYRRKSRGPIWDGSDLNGRTIVLRAEQGIGDTIQFIRYVPLVVQRGGRVIAQVQPELIRLLQQLPGVEKWIARDDALPPFDVQCPLLSLPRIFGTALATIPAQKQPLRADPDLANAWRERLAQQTSGAKIGLVWAGSPTHRNDRNRSIPLSLFSPLAGTANAQFYSLQKGAAAAQAAHSPPGMRIIDWTDQLHDFADTAALIAHLDLIISVDTAVAHLAAAMGKPVWLLLPRVPDWRWQLDRGDSPWYPTMRLFRQTGLSRWPDVIDRVAQALASFKTA